VPYYSFALVNEPGEDGVAPYLYTQRSHQLSSLIFTQDAAVVEAYSHTSRGNEHVHLTGSPKLDSLVSRAVAKPHNRYTLVWAPHHSYSSHWLNFGTFASMYREMLDFAKSHQDIDIVMRPHPFMFGTLVDRKVIDEQELNDWLSEFNALPNTSINTDGDFASLFLSSDSLLTDGVSFIGEYPMITGKPAVYLENPGRWKFSPIGEIAVEANWRIGSFAEFANRFDDIRTIGLGDYSAAIARLRQAASPYPGESAARLVEIVATDFAAETPLVDKNSITEVAWELGPGKEPLVD
jgi:serine/threonine protein kinase